MDVAPVKSFAHLLFPENILLGLKVSNKQDAFAQTALLLERQHQISGAEVYENLCAREQLGSTALGEGVAIPHARVKGLRQPMAAFVRLATAIPFDAPDDKPVSELVVLLVPMNAASAHLQLLAEIAEMLCDRDFRQRLAGAAEPREVLE
ncbi:MAG: PTS sugar transporter subunit IIA, partial [Noviherbaspirillum sp.]